MTASEVFHSTQIMGNQYEEKVSSYIIYLFECQYGKITFPKSMSSLNQIFYLLKKGYGEFLLPRLLQYGYNYETELQYILANIGYYSRFKDGENQYKTLLKLPSLNGIEKEKDKYIIDSKIGKLYVSPLHKWSSTSIISDYASKKDYYRLCHQASENFIRMYPQYRAVTSLIPTEFDGYQYHSYITLVDGIADFSHNVYLSMTDFDRVMKPILLSSVNGYELVEKEKEITDFSLGLEVSSLLYLAIENQKKLKG